MLQAEQRIHLQKLITRKDAIEVFLEREKEILQKDMVKNHQHNSTRYCMMNIMLNTDVSKQKHLFQEINTLNNQKKFVNFLIETHYHEKNK